MFMNLKVSHHYFCKQCGGYTFNQTAKFVDQNSVNLGCVGGIDPLAPDVELLNKRRYKFKLFQFVRRTPFVLGAKSYIESV